MEFTVENTNLGAVTIKDRDKDSGMRWIKAEFLPVVDCVDNTFTYKGQKFSFVSEMYGGIKVYLNNGKFPLPCYSLPAELKPFADLMKGKFSTCEHHREDFLEKLRDFINKAPAIEREVFRHLDNIIVHVERMVEAENKAIEDFKNKATSMLQVEEPYTIGDLSMDMNDYCFDLPVYVWIDGARHEVESAGIECVCGEEIFELNIREA